MNTNKPNTAFILAAGKGTRMQPLTDTMPKPMVSINSQPILHHALNKLKQFGIKKTIINLFYLGNVIEDYIAKNISGTFVFSKEKELLETGGGVKHALPLLPDEPIFLINGDAFWVDKPEQTCLEKLAQYWDSDKMDILLLLQPVTSMTHTKAVGDYNLNKDGKATRTPDGSGHYMFTGIRITKTNLFENTPNGAFSYLEIMDKAEENGALYGVVNDGQWHHISTPEDLERVNMLMSESA